LKKKDDKDKEIILKNLLYMLSLTKNLDIKESEISKISKSKNPFLEILIKIYANSLFECLKRFVPKNYVNEEDNLNFLKGKLLFSKHIIKNSVNQAKFYCQYDEFSENNILNQLFYYVSRLLYFVSNDNENKRVLKFITDFFCDIDFKKINIYKIRNLQLTKNQKLFQKPFDLAKMFLENSSIDMNQHKIKTISLLWDMNILFEEFIFEFIKRNKEKIHKEINEINYQKGKRLLYCDETKQHYGNTFVDIFLKLNNKKIIVDTKYKINDGKIGEFANSDIFQMITYETIHNSQNAILIYPTVNKETENKYVLCEDNYKDNKHHISTATIYLGYNLQENKETLINRLSEILKSTIN
jgi:5-methylcytosine-specific restriction enzyme subunit McrC